MHRDLWMEESLSKKQFGFKQVKIALSLKKPFTNLYIPSKEGSLKRALSWYLLDTEGAFDNVILYDDISETMYNSPIYPATSGWITTMVTNRFVTITHKNATRRSKA